MQRPYTTYSYAIGNLPAFEGINVEKRTATIASELGETTLNAKKWLPFASEVYNISASINDYILVPVIIMPSELPNRNGVGFPFTELTYFSPETGQLAYQTWKGKPTFVEHANQDHTKAKGIILESSLRKLHRAKGDLYKVVLLTAWDRTRDPLLANSILTGERKSYSMGAMCRDYRCTICGSLHSKGGCEHTALRKPSFDIIGGKLAYLEALDPIGFECSSVADPAFVSAESNPQTDVIPWWSQVVNQEGVKVNG